MDDKNMRERKGFALLEHMESREDLNRLRGIAARAIFSIDRVKDILESAADGDTMISGNKVKIDINAAIGILSDPIVIDSIDKDNIITIARDIHQAEERVWKAEQELKILDLG